MKYLRRATTLVLLLLAAQLCLGSTTSAQTSNQSTQRTTTARAGDTIAKIAERLGIPAAELAQLNKLSEGSRVRKGTTIYLPESSSAATNGEVIGNKITLADGYTFQADEVWRQNGEVWYRKGNIRASVNREVKSIKPIIKAPVPAPTPAPDPNAALAKTPVAVWIHLVDGAKFRVDEVQETTEGAWYNRANISNFIAKDRIASIERELPSIGKQSIVNRDWTSGNLVIDELIKTNGSRFGVDPYLVFLVIEKESRFRTRALSPKGALGLMQLMPSTAHRFGVTKPYDAGQNIMAGTRYLRELMDTFGGQVNLVLASYNAGEGAVIKYGRSVPPYRETRDYVKTIGKRYGLSGRESNADNDVPSPQK
jgi:LysM repeat protein